METFGWHSQIRWISRMDWNFRIYSLQNLKMIVWRISWNSDVNLQKCMEIFYRRLAFTKVESQSLWAAYDNDTSSLDYPDLEKTDIIPVIRENFNKGKHWKMYLTKTLWIDV